MHAYTSARRKERLFMMRFYTEAVKILGESTGNTARKNMQISIFPPLKTLVGLPKLEGPKQRLPNIL